MRQTAERVKQIAARRFSDVLSRPRVTRQSIKHGVRRLVLAVPGGRHAVRAHTAFRARRELARWFPAPTSTREVFQHHYETNAWGSAESVSGPGSTLIYTENVRRLLPEVAERFGVRRILDAPCGDYNWMRALVWKSDMSYVGGDIVEQLVQRNQALYGTDSVRFVTLDITSDPLPDADLWLCRDCLFHLSERDIFDALTNFLRSNIPYLLTSNHPACEVNCDVPTGSFRLLDLRLPPFSFAQPLLAIDDWIEGFPQRQLALWTRDAVGDAVARHNARRVLAGHKT